MTSAATGPTSRSKNDALFDSGILIQYLRGNRRAADLLNQISAHGVLSISVVTVTEILVGAIDETHRAAAYEVIRAAEIIPVTLDVAEKAAALIRKYPPLFGKGISRGIADAFIGATAWSLSLPLYTLDTRDFVRATIAEFSIHPINPADTSWK